MPAYAASSGTKDDAGALAGSLGVEFLEVPDSYYETLLERVGPIREDISAIRDLRILVDRDGKI